MPTIDKYRTRRANKNILKDGDNMLIQFQGQQPTINAKTFIAQGAIIIGNVNMKEYSSVWFNSTVRGDVDDIEIGRYTNVQDNSIIHLDHGFPCTIGDFVTIGHNSIIHGCTIEDHCLIGMGAVIMNGVRVGRGSIIAAGAVVKENMVIPPHSLVVGVPAKITREIPEKFDSIHAQALKYKTLWTEHYGILPQADGERYEGQEII